MNCQDLINLLDNRLHAGLTAAQEERIGEHLLVCESCESAWRASRMLRSFAATIPESAPRAGLLEETMRLATGRSGHSHERPGPFWMGGALGVALAASLAVAAVLVIGSPIAPKRDDVSPSLAIALAETRDITFAIDSAESLANAQVQVALSGGIELAGGQGRRELRWTTDISPGVNRLTIPVTAVNGEEGELLVEVEHGSKYRRFLVHVDIVSAADGEKFTAG